MAYVESRKDSPSMPAIVQDLLVITRKGNAAFYQEAVGRSHTIVPDALAMSPKPPKIERERSCRDSARDSHTLIGYFGDARPS